MPPWRAPIIAGFAARRAASKARGRLRGIGVGCFLETSRGAPNEGAEVRFESDGTVTGRGRHRVERPGPRDRLRPDRRRPAGRADAGDPLRAGRHARGEERRGPRRRALHAYGRRGRGQGDRRGARQGARRWRRIFCRRRSEELAFADGRFVGARQPTAPSRLRRWRESADDPANLPDGMTRGLGVHVMNMTDVFTFPERLPRRRGRDRSRDRRDDAAALHRRRRLRPADQSDADRGPGAGRRHPGHRPGDARAHGLRSRARASCSAARSWTTPCRAPTICRASTSR